MNTYYDLYLDGVFQQRVWYFGYLQVLLKEDPRLSYRIFTIDR